MKTPYNISKAEFSEDKTCRFQLERGWGNNLNIYRLYFIGLNPSTANNIKDDATIRRVVEFSKNFGFRGVVMLNLFPFITAKPSELKQCTERQALINRNYLSYYATFAQNVVFAWGAFPEAKSQLEFVSQLFPKALCLGKNMDGSPKHPLYLPKETKLIPFN